MVQLIGFLGLVLIIFKGDSMTLKEIINKLEEIEGSLDDAFYSLPEYNANTDSKDYIDSARSELYCLKGEIEKDHLLVKVKN